MLIEAASFLCSDEPQLRQGADNPDDGDRGLTGHSRYRPIARPALMGPPVFPREQAGVDQEGRGREAKEEDFIGQREKVPACGPRECWGRVLCGDNEPAIRQHKPDTFSA